MDEKKLSAMSEDKLDDVAGGNTNYDYYGNPIGPMVTNAVTADSMMPGLSCTIRNGVGAAYACPTCGSTNFRLVSANDSTINLQCKNCKTKFSVANL